jgi:hypothetical protein
MSHGLQLLLEALGPVLPIDIDIGFLLLRLEFFVVLGFIHGGLG